MKYCTNCQAELADDAQFCTECGQKVEPEAECEGAEEAAAETVIETAPCSEGEAAECADEAEVIEEDNAEGADAAEVSEEDEAAEDDAVPEDADGISPEDTNETEETEAAVQPKKNRWTWLTTVIVIVAAVIILGILGVFFWQNGTLKSVWDSIRPKTKSVCTIGDYSQIEVSASDVAVDDSTVESYISSTLGDDATDETVQEFAAVYSDCDATNMEEFKEYAKNYIYKYYLHNSMMDYLKSITEVKSYDEEWEQKLIDYSNEELSYYASSYGVDADVLATYYGYEDAAAYAESYAHDYMDSAMILDKIAKDIGFTYTDEDIDAGIQEYLDQSGYSSYYTLDEFKEITGEVWVYLYENMTYKFDHIMEAIESNVVIVESDAEESSESAETTTAAQ